MSIIRSKEYREKMSKILTGRKLTDEHRKKIGEANKRRIISEETRKKLRLAGYKNHKGKHNTEEMRRKMSETMKGEKSSLWKGGISPENIKIRNGIEFRLWREAVFARDNWTCQKCGEREILQSHHIQDFSQYPELRFAIDNGIIFCKNCHLNFHKIYGKRNNTKEQLSEFLL